MVGSKHLCCCKFNGNISVHINGIVAICVFEFLEEEELFTRYNDFL